MPVVSKSAKPDAATTIDSFQGEYSFLSNFYSDGPTNIILDNEIYPTVEHAYQAAKFSSPKRRAAIRTAATPAEAKRLGRTLGIADPDWDSRKLTVMKSLLKQKFSKGSVLAEKLILTNPRELIEGNTWNDRFWGVCDGKGSNHLGKLLMERRDKLIAMQTATDVSELIAPVLKELESPVVIEPKPSFVIKNVSRRIADDSVVLHSSLAPFAPSTHDAEFPTFPRAIGVIARVIPKSGEIIIEQEWPTLTSVIRGEKSTRDEIEQLTEDKIQELINRCRTVAHELGAQATRLEKQLSSRPLTHFPADTPMPRSATSGARYIMSKVDEPSSPLRSSKPASTPKQPKSPRTSFAESDLLAALNDD